MSLPLSYDVDVTYELASIGAPRANFNLGLIIGSSTVISPSTRVKIYTSVAEMEADGFINSSNEVQAATLYFENQQAPKQVAIGRQDVGETLLEAVQACRAKNTAWYLVACPEAVDADHLAIAAYVQTLTAPYVQYIVQTFDADVLNNVSGNLFETLNNENLWRTHGGCISTPYSMAGITGYAMGQTTDFANSAYTLKFKSIIGVVADDLDINSVLNVKVNNGNVYVNVGDLYQWYEDGTNFGGFYFDEIIYLDKLVNQIQINVANLLNSVPKIAQTEEGMAQIRTAIQQACANLVTIGFIAPGVWTGGNILTVKTGDYLDSGFLVLSDSIDSQDPNLRAQRISPNFYVLVKLAGAIQTVLIKVPVNR